MKAQRGFTLIELLVVIAIIAILSAVVLASLNSARARGANASVKSNLANMRAEAQIYFENNNAAYGAVNASCFTASTVFTDPQFVAARANITSASGIPTCQNTPSQWVMMAPLKVSEGAFTYWCVDSTGASKGQTTAQAAIINTAGNYNCQ